MLLPRSKTAKDQVMERAPPSSVGGGRTRSPLCLAGAPPPPPLPRKVKNARATTTKVKEAHRLPPPPLRESRSRPSSSRLTLAQPDRAPPCQVRGERRRAPSDGPRQPTGYCLCGQVIDSVSLGVREIHCGAKPAVGRREIKSGGGGEQEPGREDEHQGIPNWTTRSSFASTRIWDRALQA